jgi:hypothetical protein
MNSKSIEHSYVKFFNLDFGQSDSSSIQSLSVIFPSPPKSLTLGKITAIPTAQKSSPHPFYQAFIFLVPDSASTEQQWPPLGQIRIWASLMSTIKIYIEIVLQSSTYPVH